MTLLNGSEVSATPNSFPQRLTDTPLPRRTSSPTLKLLEALLAELGLPAESGTDCVALGEAQFPLTHQLVQSSPFTWPNDDLSGPDKLCWTNLDAFLRSYPTTMSVGTWQVGSKA